MRRALAALSATLLGVVWLVTFKVTPLDVAVVPSQSARSAPPPPTASATVSSRTPTPTSRLATPLPTAAGTPADSGTFSGTTIDTRYGPVQVRIVVSGQKIVDVQALQLPRDRARSAFISQYSAPLLRTEAIQAQNAQIDVVSGATYTSIAYERSLDSALKQANLG
jgi:uncharacterized protein with FMN-binding domain